MSVPGWVSVEREQAQSRYNYITTDIGWALPQTEFIVCQYCGSQKIGTGPARCLSCGASSWKVEVAK